MKILILLITLFFSVSTIFAQEKKTLAVNSIQEQKTELISLSKKIWSFAETSLQETNSAKLLADYAEKQGFKVERGVAELPTGFIASYGEGKPVIAIVGEFDALPGLSQKVSSTKEPFLQGQAGHGCGHNLFGTASLGAAVAIKDMIAIGSLKGTIRFYGTPAEEAYDGKAYMVRAGLFKDVDVCLAWHPREMTRADTQSTKALVNIYVEFRGKTAHASRDPWNGRSALDALELFTHGVNLMREHVKQSVRMHYVIRKGGEAPNVVPDYAMVELWIRDSTGKGVNEVLERVRKLATGAALMAEVEPSLSLQGGAYNLLVNQTGAKMLYENMKKLGDIDYSPEEQEFARQIQIAVGVEPKGMNSTLQPLEEPIEDPPGASTDLGDVSWNVPTLHISVTTAPEGVPWHSWPVVACAGMSIGEKGMLHAAKSLAVSMVELFEDSRLRETIRTEFNEKTRGHVYKPYIPDGPPPKVSR